MKSIYVLLFLAGATSFAEAPGIMKNLIDLRSELEVQSREIETLQKEKQSELDLWVQKKLELEAQLQKENLRQMQLDEKRARLANHVKSESKGNPSARAELLNWITRATTWVEEAVPFLRDQRLENLARLKERANRGIESTESLSSELWLFYENEFKLATENEYRIIDVMTSSGLQKAEVARLGFFAMYARTTDGAIQQSTFTKEGWELKPLEGRYIDEVSRLIENMKAKRKSGVYALPVTTVKETL